MERKTKYIIDMYGKKITELNTNFKNPTFKEFLLYLRDLRIKDYKLIKHQTDTAGNFFVWKKNKGSHYKRLILMNEGWNEKTLFYWNLETDFKPFNRIKGKEYQSEKFKFNELNKLKEEFYKIVGLI